MEKETVIEIAACVIVSSAIFIVSPAAGKLLDSLYIKPFHFIAPNRMLVLAALIIMVLGTVTVAWTILLFKIRGKGTPNPKLPPKSLIVVGPCKYSRNPRALGGFITLLGESLLYYSPSLLGIALLFAVIITLNAIYVEEPQLKERFGDAYLDYMQEVPRLFPNPFMRKKSG